MKLKRITTFTEAEKLFRSGHIIVDVFGREINIDLIGHFPALKQFRDHGFFVQTYEDQSCFVCKNKKTCRIISEKSALNCRHFEG